MSNRLFVAYKPSNMSSNYFLSSIKKRYNQKKAGFSGTLDPFAKGVLIIAFGQYSKLFRYLQKTPKTYKATLWLGASSDSLDIENISKIEVIKPFHYDSIGFVLKDLQGTLTYTPPKYSAKKINGIRAYKLAREDKEVKLREQTMEVYNLELVNYMHPFLTFQASVSEGAYIRSLGEIIAKRFGFDGALCALERVREGSFVYENEKSLNPLEFLDLTHNEYMNDPLHVKLGKVLHVKDFKIQEDGEYVLIQDDEFAIIKIENKKVKYELNKVALC